MNDAYFCWLVGLIGDRYIQENYRKLLWKLYTKEFVWELDYDENRASDGLYLRKIFVENGGDFSPVAGCPAGCPKGCSVLEMMIALARKAEDDIMYDPDYGDRSGLWFWTMIENLGLDIYDDMSFSEKNVDMILEVFMHHLYRRNGSGGGMFAVKNQCREMRKTDLWWQLNAYFLENFPVGVW